MNLPTSLLFAFLITLSSVAWAEEQDKPDESVRCSDILTESRRPREDFVLSDPVIEDSFRWYSEVGSAGMRSRLYETPNTPEGREDFQKWALGLLNSREMLFEIGLITEEEYSADVGGYPPLQLDLEGVDALIDSLSLFYLAYTKIKTSGYAEYPQSSDPDGHTFSRFESWAIELQSIYDEAREKHMDLNTRFHQNLDASLTLQKRVDAIVRHTAHLVGARQEIFEYLLTAPVPLEMRLILESTVLPEIGRRIYQLSSAFQERNALYLEVTERVLRQKDRIMALDDLLAKMDE
jgi:hypothetical protein